MQQAAAPIQVATVRNHLLTAWSFGKPLELQRVLHEADTVLPCEAEWLQMEEAAVSIKADFEAEVKLKELLQVILGEKVNAMEKSLEEKEVERRWYDKLRLFETFKRVGFVPHFDSAKRQRRG